MKFDPDLYISLNPDVVDSGMGAWEHLIWHGIAEDRPVTNEVSASDLISVAPLEGDQTSRKDFEEWYAKAFDLAVYEARLIHEYLEFNPDVRPQYVEEHFRDNAAYERRRFSRFFSPTIFDSILKLPEDSITQYVRRVLNKDLSYAKPADFFYLFDPSKLTGRIGDVVHALSSRAIPTLTISPYLYPRWRFKNEVMSANVAYLDTLRSIFAGGSAQDLAEFSPHPLFDQSYIASHISHGTVLTWFDYVVTKDLWIESTSFFLDVKYVNHLMVQAGAPGCETEPGLCLYAKHSSLNSRQPSAASQFGGKIQVSPSPHVSFELIDLLYEQLEADTEDVYTYLIEQHAETGISEDVQITSADGLCDVTAIVLDYNKPIIAYISALLAARSPHVARVYIVENGCEPYFVQQLRKATAHSHKIEIIALERNRFFGEGNNIAIDKISTEFVLFLNNDCFITLEALAKVRKTCLHVHVGAAGPRFHNNDRFVVEAGGAVTRCGTVSQYSKGLYEQEFLRLGITDDLECEYISAACLLVKSKILQEIGGFDYIFDPFYYEDTDLCTRIRRVGYSIISVRSESVLHYENFSTAEFLTGRIPEMAAANRLKYASRWSTENVTSESLRQRYNKSVQKVVDIGHNQDAVIFTPFNLQAGGGERYILKLASVLAEKHDVLLVTADEHSLTRVRFVLHDLGIKNADFEFTSLENFRGRLSPRLFVAMGNEIEPPIAACGRDRNIYHCQFPFPLANVGRSSVNRLFGYDSLIVNSKFTKKYTERVLSEVHATLPIEVVYPPVVLAGSIQGAKRRKILNVGRITNQGHAKRQDIFLKVVQQLRSAGVDFDAEIIGGIAANPTDLAYLKWIREEAARLDVAVSINASREYLENSMAEASIYLHCAGFGLDAKSVPEQCEHFGITIVEAMSAGCIPIAVDAGGATEFVERGGGYLYTDVDSATKRIVEFLQLSASDLAAAGMVAREVASDYSEEAFARSVLSVARLRTH